ncbi:NnrU family protein [Porphyrobacter sp. CACIAM 03H1]|uniref:NnrU family protein n=1 Tax=Porphyrobacter sp. CACIAM 03H1 TaxID=2003315 RepID=UPI000B5A496E|nr:NnrU family protein [Porphyrobacter sp. CACIAM 03H1]ASJ89902.1 MFS transporter [Porphyrobacter sp. CACIAM 03H1]
MDGNIIALIAANIAFVGSHFAMSHPLRGPMVKALGAGGFQLAYTAVSFATLAWVYFAFLAAPAADLPGSGEAGWIIATILTWPAMVLLAGSFIGNPALPTPQAEAQTRAEPRGALRVTRHPMMWGIGLWAISHLVLFWSTRTMVTALAMGILALVGARLQDAKKEALMGAAWAKWESKTSYWPRWGRLLSVGAVPLLAGTALWIAGSWVHLWRAGIPAGVFRWIG